MSQQLNPNLSLHAQKFGDNLFPLFSVFCFFSFSCMSAISMSIMNGLPQSSGDISGMKCLFVGITRWRNWKVGF